MVVYVGLGCALFVLVLLLIRFNTFVLGCLAACLWMGLLFGCFACYCLMLVFMFVIITVLYSILILLLWVVYWVWYVDLVFVLLFVWLVTSLLLGLLGFCFNGCGFGFV